MTQEENKQLGVEMDFKEQKSMLYQMSQFVLMSDHWSALFRHGLSSLFYLRVKLVAGVIIRLVTDTIQHDLYQK